MVKNGAYMSNKEFLTGKNVSMSSGDLTVALADRLCEKIGGIESEIFRKSWLNKETPLGMRYWVSASSLSGANDRSGWPTATVRDYKDTGNLSTSMVRKDGKSRMDTLARLAWSTQDGSLPETRSSILNPALGRWLMGFSEAWCLAAIKVSKGS